MEMKQNPSSGETTNASTAMDALNVLEWRRTCWFMGKMILIVETDITGILKL